VFHWTLWEQNLCICVSVPVSTLIFSVLRLYLFLYLLCIIILLVRFSLMTFLIGISMFISISWGLFILSIYIPFSILVWFAPFLWNCLLGMFLLCWQSNLGKVGDLYTLKTSYLSYCSVTVFLNSHVRLWT
jgi:hypothetical protein